MGELVKIGTVADVEPGRPLVHDFDYDTVVVFQVGDEYFCLEDVCSHQEIALSDGKVEDCRVECPLHGSWFDLRNGAALNRPAIKAVKTFPIEIRGEDIYVEEPDDAW